MLSPVSTEMGDRLLVHVVPFWYVANDPGQLCILTSMGFKINICNEQIALTLSAAMENKGRYGWFQLRD